MSDRETIIKNCENWVNTHEGENYLLTYSSVVELLTALKEQEIAYQGAVELLRQKMILFEDAIQRLKKQETKWIHREDLDFKDKLGYNHFHGMCENCGFVHDFIDGHTGQYKYCPQCGRTVKWE